MGYKGVDTTELIFDGHGYRPTPSSVASPVAASTR
jgi:hypothetical protein